MVIYRSEDVYGVEDYCFERSDDCLLGVIKRDPDGYWVFSPARKATMTCKQLRDLSVKLSEMNTGGGL